MRFVALGALGALVACSPAVAPQAPEGPSFSLPIACEIGRTCEVQNYVDRDPGPGARDYRCGGRTYDGHKGVDFRIPDMAAQRRGVDVLAAAPGRVARLRDGVEDISIRAPGAPPVAGRECGNGVVIDHGEGWETQYCHLAQGSIQVAVGQAVAAGQPLARVGLSGATEFPHVHFQVRRDGQVVDPFGATDGSHCGLAASAPRWTRETAAALTYKEGAVLNAGFADAPVEMADLEEARVVRPGAASPMLVAYVRAIGLQEGDVIELSLRGPDGAVLAHSRLAPLDHDKAHYLAYIGSRRPAGGWPTGAYRAGVRVHRGGRVALARDFAMGL